MTHLRHQIQPVIQTDQPGIEPHIAIDDMRDLMGHDALQLIAGQSLERAAAGDHHRAIAIKSRGQSIDRRFVFEYEGTRHADAGRNCELFQQILQPPMQRIVDGIDRHRAQAPGDQRAVVTQPRGFDPGATHDQTGHDQSVGEKKSFRIGRWPEEQLPDQRRHGVHAEDHRKTGQRVQPDQPIRGAISLRLVSCEVHARATRFESAATKRSRRLDCPARIRTRA